MALLVDAARKTYWSPVIKETSLLQDAVIELRVADSQRYGPSRGGFLFYPSGGSTGGDMAIGLLGRRAIVQVNWLTGEARCDMS